MLECTEKGIEGVKKGQTSNSSNPSDQEAKIIAALRANVVPFGSPATPHPVFISPYDEKIRECRLISFFNENSPSALDL